MYTINQIVSAYKVFADAHQQINHFDCGDIEDFATSGTTTYPALYLDYEPGTVTVNEDGGFVLVTFKFYILDRLLKGQGNLAEVFSDTQRIAIDAIAHAQSQTYFGMTRAILYFGDVTLEPKKDYFHSDEVAGWSFDLTFKYSYESDLCEIPQSGLIYGGSTTSEGGGTVNILDQNGNVMATVNAGGTYSVVVWAGIDEGGSTTTYTDGITDQ